MIVEQYGVKYHRVTARDLETIRYWRNQPHIRSVMQFREYITPGMQLEWFSRINNPYNYYFVITYNDRQIGLINCKDTAPDTRIAEGGIFIWEEEYWGTPVPVFAALTMLEAVFEVFQSGDASIVTVLKENKRALDFNKLLGYEISGENEGGDCFRMLLTKEKFLRHAPRLKRAASAFSGGKSALTIIASPGPSFAEEVNMVLRRMNATP